jgi:hypothetical protein
MQKFLKLLPSILPLVLAVAAVFEPSAQAFVAAHAGLASVLAALVAIINHALPSSRS